MCNKSIFIKSVLVLPALVVLVFAGGIPSDVSADIIRLTLSGAAGNGITAANEPGNTGNGSGGLLGNLTFDTDTNELFADIGWGSGHGAGFNDLTSDVTLLNIHGPTADGAPDSFNQNGPGLITLNPQDTSADNGRYTGTVQLPVANDLLTGRLYIHIHTANNTGGEARGYLVAVPEPATGGVLGILFALSLLKRRRRIH